jgi:WD40 repeat protein
MKVQFFGSFALQYRYKKYSPLRLNVNKRPSFFICTVCYIDIRFLCIWYPDCVLFIESNNFNVYFSVSQDQTAMVWQWNSVANAVECVHVLRGHTRGLESVTVDPGKCFIATGGWDTHVNIWSTSGEN